MDFILYLVMLENQTKIHFIRFLAFMPVEYYFCEILPLKEILFIFACFESLLRGLLAVNYCSFIDIKAFKFSTGKFFIHHFCRPCLLLTRFLI